MVETVLILGIVCFAAAMVGAVTVTCWHGWHVKRLPMAVRSSELESRVAELTGQLAELDKQRIAVEADIERLRGEQAGVAQEVAKGTRETHDLREARDELETRIRNMKEMLRQDRQRHEEAETRAPELAAELSELEAQITRARAEASEATAAVKTARDERDRLIAEAEALSAKIEERERRLEEQLAGAADRLRQLEGALDSKFEDVRDEIKAGLSRLRSSGGQSGRPRDDGRRRGR